MKQPIIDFVNTNYKEDNNINALPLVHSCEGFSLESIFEEQELKVAECPVFKQNYLYLFYGKPAYSVAQKVNGTRTDSLYAPCCLIFKNSEIDIAKVFPFDSGGYMNGIYEGYFHKKMDIDKFELENSIDGIRKYIKVFFDDNDEYINGIAKRISATNAYVNSLINLLLAEGSSQMDERSRTVEIVTDKNIKLENNLVGIVLPKNLLRVQPIKKFLIEKEIFFETYFIRPLTRPVEYNQVVFERVMKIIGKLNL